MGRWHTWLACVILVAACGGQSIDDESTGGAAGDVGSGGTGDGGSANRGGSANMAGKGGSGARAGSSATGGTLSTGGSISFGGATTGGSATTAGTGTSVSGSGGTAGTGTAPECQLPLVTGNCNAAFQRYGFNAESGHCEKFLYGGCGANQNNFETLAACEARCGGSAQGHCPESMPQTGSECAESTPPCHYTQEACLCDSDGSSGFCWPFDPQCPYLPREARSDALPCTGPDCPLPIVVPTPYVCECSSGAWSCDF